MLRIIPHLRFNDGKCAEAVEFYKNVFGGELTIQKVSDTDFANEMPAENRNRIMHAELKIKGLTIFASDMMRDKATVGDNISLGLDCESREEIESLFDKLSAGGEVFMPIEKPYWGGLFGVVTDKYGVEWMLAVDQKRLK